MEPAVDIKKHIGSKIGEKRTELGYTQEEIAKYLNVNRITIYNIEKGINNTSAENLYKICCALNLKPNELFPKVNPVSSKSIKIN